MIGRRPRIAVGICAHNEEDFIEYALRGIYDFADVIGVCVNVGVPWGGAFEELDSTLDLVRSFPDPARKLRILPGEWTNEIDQRNTNLDLVRGEADYFMVLDADEFYTARDLDRIRPSTRFVGLRKTTERLRCVIPRGKAILHHFSYARTSEMILQKIRNFSHRDQIVPDWFERVWNGWDADPLMENLHPTNPPEYRCTVPVDPSELPEILQCHPYLVDEITAPLPITTFRG